MATDDLLAYLEKAFQRIEKFAKMPLEEEDQFFLMFAHGYEFDFGTKESNWEKFEKICQAITQYDYIPCVSIGEAFDAHERG